MIVDNSDMWILKNGYVTAILLCFPTLYFLQPEGPVSNYCKAFHHIVHGITGLVVSNQSNLHGQTFT